MSTTALNLQIHRNNLERNCYTGIVTLKRHVSLLLFILVLNGVKLQACLNKTHPKRT